MTDHELAAALEALVDKAGLHRVVAGLETVCHEKAEHVKCNWQDNVLGGQWYRAAVSIGRVNTAGL